VNDGDKELLALIREAYMAGYGDHYKGHCKMDLYYGHVFLDRFKAAARRAVTDPNDFLTSELLAQMNWEWVNAVSAPEARDHVPPSTEATLTTTGERE
jgi:hypothetical protein